MLRILSLAALMSIGSVAGATPCPEGNNARLGDTTTASTVRSQNAARQAASEGQSAGGRGNAPGASLKNHFPH
jgi:hypothetical protein